MVYQEFRPYFLNAASYALAYVGGVMGQMYAGFMYDPSGVPAVGSVTVTTSLLTLPGQSSPQPAGLWRWEVLRTDDGSNNVVAYGVIELTDPIGQHS